jgi:long-chain fatty acid transport protein
LCGGVLFDKSLKASKRNKQHKTNLKTKHLIQTAGFIVVSTTVALLPGSALGLGIALPDQDAFATARGNAFVATANDPAAIFYNPAGISQLEGMNTSIGAYGIYYGSTFKGAESLDSKPQWAVLPQVFSTYSIPKYHLTLGLGTYSPYGLRMEWPSFTPLIGQETAQITYITVNPVVAYQICPTLSVAAGPTLNYSETEIKETPTVPNGEGGYLSFINHFRGHDIDVGYNAGILWHPWEQHYVGVTYRSATAMNYEGHATSFPPGGPDNSANASFHFPQTVDFGYSYRPTKDWNVEADAVWTDWSSLTSVTVNPNAATNPFDTLKFDWQSSWMLDFGVTRYFGDGWRVSGGYMYSMNSVPSSTYNPLVPDSDRHIFSVGVGKRYKKFSWDAAYQLAWGPPRSVSGDTFPGEGITSTDGKYEFLSNALTINFGYHF